MPRIDYFLKVEVELDDAEDASRLGSEICRQVQKIYGVRSAEVSSTITHSLPDGQ